MAGRVDRHAVVPRAHVHHHAHRRAGNNAKIGACSHRHGGGTAAANRHRAHAAFGIAAGDRQRRLEIGAVQRSPAPGGGIGAEQAGGFGKGEPERAKQYLRPQRGRIGTEQFTVFQYRQDVADAGAAEVAAGRFRHDGLHRACGQMAGGPDLIEGRCGRIRPFMAIPVAEQRQRATLIGVAAGKALQQCHGAAGHGGSRVVLQCHRIGEAEFRFRSDHFGNAGDAAAVCPFQAKQMRIAGRNVHFVGGGDPAIGRVVLHRHQFRIEQPGPAVGLAGGHRQQAITGRAHRHEAARRPADIAGAIGKQQIERRRPPMIAGDKEIIPSLCRPRPAGVEIGRRAGLGPGGAQGETVARRGIFVDDRAVVGELQHHLARGFALHLDALAHFGEFRRLGVHHQILLIDGEDGDRPGHILVVAKTDPGQRRLARSGDLQFRRVDVRQVTQVGHGMGAVRIIGQYRTAGGRLACADHPVVAAFLDVGIEAGHHDLLAIKTHIAGAERIIIKHVGRDAARVEPLGGAHRVRWRQLAA